MKKEVLFGKLLLCFLLFLIWCCLMPTAAIGANGEAAAEDYVTTIVVLPSDPPSKVEWCFKLEIQECAMLVGGYYAVISGNEFLVYPQPYDILTLIDMLQDLFSQMDELSGLFVTEISLISGPPLLVTIDEFEHDLAAGTRMIIGEDVISQQPIPGDVADGVGPPEDTPEPAPEPTLPEAPAQTEGLLPLDPEQTEPTAEEPTESKILPTI